MKKIILGLLFTMSSTVLFVTSHTIVKGDTLWDIAGTYYSKNSLWPAISDVNSLANPNSVPIGTVLVIPSKSDAEAICNETDSAKKAELIARIKGETGADTDSDTDTSSDKPYSKPEKVSKVKYVAPTAEDTNFDTFINGDVSSDHMVEVSDSSLESSDK